MTVLHGSAPSAPGAPAVTATGGNGRVTLSWSAVTGATSYNVYRSVTKGGPYAALFKGLASGAATVTYSDTLVSNATTYYYTVKAVNLGGEGVKSNEATATPAAGLVDEPKIAPPPGLYNSSAPPNITLSCTTFGAIIHYTLDGSIPTLASPVYSAPFTLPASAVVQAGCPATASSPERGCRACSSGQA